MFNIKAIPGQLASAGKALFNKVTGNEQGAGGEIAAGLPASTTGEADLSKANQGNAASDVAFIKSMNALRSSGKSLTPVQQQFYDRILQTHSSVGTQTDLLPHAADTTGEALGNVAGVAADALGAGSFSKAGLVGDKALTTELTKEAPAAISAAKTTIDAAKSAVTTTTEDAAAKDSAKIADMVGPKLTAKEGAQALASRGGTKTGLLGTIKANTDPAVQRIADTVQQHGPDFSPKKSLIENINARFALPPMASPSS
jgi:hypothetical protein